MKAMILGAAALLAASSVQASDVSDLRAIGQGRSLYLNHCASCHGTDAHGAGRLAAQCSRAVPDLTAFAERHGGWKAQRVQQHIRAEGRGGMPAWGRVLVGPLQTRGEGAAARDIWLLTRYIEWAQAPGASVAKEAPADEAKPRGR
jgi:mono/diheme cytochrome c family protein